MSNMSILLLIKLIHTTTLLVNKNQRSIYNTVKYSNIEYTVLHHKVR